MWSRKKNATYQAKATRVTQEMVFHLSDDAKKYLPTAFINAKRSISYTTKFHKRQTIDGYYLVLTDPLEDVELMVRDLFKKVAVEGITLTVPNRDDTFWIPPHGVTAVYTAERIFEDAGTITFTGEAPGGDNLGASKDISYTIEGETTLRFGRHV